jgi:hypothetical protein
MTHTVTIVRETASDLPPDWRAAVRDAMRTAWDALDRAQMVLSRSCCNTLDPGARRFRQDFDALCGELVDAIIDEVFPLTPEELGEDETNDELDLRNA